MKDTGELPLALRAAYLGLHRRTDAQFVPYGVTADQFVLLATLQRGGAMNQRDLARQMPSDPSTVRAMLVLLEKQGLVTRATDPTDSRALLVTLTTAGKRKFKQLWKAGDQIRQEMYAAIPSHELEIVTRNLQQLGIVLGVDAPSRAVATAKR